MASLASEGGKRFLHCSLCETGWRFARAHCPFCSNDRHQKLAYLQADSEPGYRVDLCKRCGRYIKTIDLREMAGGNRPA